jgi:hypothetical protein
MNISATTTGGCIVIKLDTGIEMEIGPDDKLVVWDMHNRFELSLTEPGDQETGHLQLVNKQRGSYPTRADGSDVLHYYP